MKTLHFVKHLSVTVIVNYLDNSCFYHTSTQNKI